MNEINYFGEYVVKQRDETGNRMLTLDREVALLKP